MYTRKDRSSKHVFGREVLGPILYEFCARLRLYQLSFAQTDAQVLYVARGGLRLRYLYEEFLRRNGLRPMACAHDAYLSRVAVAKGCLSHDPDYVSEVIVREFAGVCLGDMLNALLKTSLPAEPQLQQPASVEGLLGSYRSPTPLGDRLRDYFGQQSRLLEDWVKQTIGDASHILLVDVGWTGNTQAMLMRRFPDREWLGLYFGRWDYRRARPNHFHNVIGISVDSAGYVPWRDETAILHYHHLIEDPLEIDWPSVGGFVRGATGLVEPDVGFAPMAVIAPTENDLHFRGIVEYFESCPAPADILFLRRRSRMAYHRLAKSVLFPCQRDLAALTVRERSADFCRADVVPILQTGPRASVREYLLRIKRSLWRQGQIAYDHPRTGALILRALWAAQTLRFVAKKLRTRSSRILSRSMGS